MRGGKREGAGRKPLADSNTKMFFLRVSEKLFSRLSILTPAEKRQLLEKGAERKEKKILKDHLTNL